MNQNMILGDLSQVADPSRIEFVERCPETTDVRDTEGRWFTINALKGALVGGLIKQESDTVIILLPNTRTFKRDDGCHGFTNSEPKKRH